jgi:prepilin-type N-terminal cleavage/methylation domain-containing protein
MNRQKAGQASRLIRKTAETAVRLCARAGSWLATLAGSPGTVGVPRTTRAFNLSELLVVLAVLGVLAAVALPVVANVKAKARRTQCTSNLNQVGRAELIYADANNKALPLLRDSPPPGAWWWYKEQVKSHIGLTGPSSPNDTVFACPSDRGYGDTGRAVPFCRSAKHDFTSYVFNGVNLPGVPNIAGRDVTTIKEPAKTLLVMEWTAHAPLSWHRSRTGQANTPFYNDAESVVTFVDGHTAFIKIYFDGINPAYTRDPIAGYDYRYSGD